MFGYFFMFILFIMNSSINKINNFFKYTLPEIYNIHKGNKVRHNKLTIQDIIKYLAFYCDKNSTKTTSSQKANSKIDRTCYDKKIDNIPVDFFKIFFYKIKILFNEIINDPKIKTIQKMIGNNIQTIYDNNGDEYNISSVDGTCYDTIRDDKLFTNMDVHIIDNKTQTQQYILSNDSEIRTFWNNKNNNSNKNNEIELFKLFLTKNDNKNTIYLMDKAYSSYVFIKYLIDNDIKFIIRLKDNYKILGDTEPISKESKQLIKYIKNNSNIKIINRKLETTQKITLGTNKHKIININVEYHLITNLGNCNDYSDDLIISLYSRRWDIESYFGILKCSFKYEVFHLKDNEEIEKIKHINSSIIILIKLLILVSLANDYEKNIEKLNPTVKIRSNFEKLDMRFKKNKFKYAEFKKCKTYDANVNVNFSDFCKTFFSDALIHLIDGKLNNDLINTLNKKIIIKKDRKFRSFERKSIIPFTKWYVKMYHKFYETNKILNAIITDTVNNLHPNLKTKAKKIIKQITESKFNIKNDTLANVKKKLVI